MPLNDIGKIRGNGVLSIGGMTRRRTFGPGTFAPTLGVMSYQQGYVPIGGSLNSTLDPLTSTATGTLPIAGTLTQTLGALTSSGAGTLPIVGTATQTLGTLTTTATGTLPIVGTSTVTLAALTSTGAGVLPIVGTATLPLGALTAAATGALPIVGTLTRTLGVATSSGAGVLPITGTLSQALGPLSATATGTLAGGPLHGVLSVTLLPLTLTAGGIAALPPTPPERTHRPPYRSRQQTGEAEDRGNTGNGQAASRANVGEQQDRTNSTGVEGMAKTMPNKKPLEVLDYKFDFSALMEPGDSFTAPNVTVTITPRTVGDTTMTKSTTDIHTTEKYVTQWIAGGTASRNYILTCRIVTAQGRTHQLDDLIPVTAY